MSVPPPSIPPSTPPSRGGDGPRESRRSRRDFNLPKHGRKGEKGEKKKDPFDMIGEGSKEIKEKLSGEKMGEMKAAANIQASEAKAAVSAVTKLIQSVVAEMKVGQVDGKDFASLNLSASADLPEAFAGSNLTVSYQENTLTIHFDNFMTPQQENNAITLVEKNKDQLMELVQTLHAKNITVHELSIGKHVVQLPRVESLPPPFQPTESGAAETRQEREHREDQGGEEGASPE